MYVCEDRKMDSTGLKAAAYMHFRDLLVDRSPRMGEFLRPSLLVRAVA